MIDKIDPQKILDELTEEEDGESCESMDFEEFVAAAMSDIADSLNGINTTLRAIAINQGINLAKIKQQSKE